MLGLLFGQVAIKPRYAREPSVGSALQGRVGRL